MASWMVHLRVADELLSKSKDLDETAFVMGNIAPDSGVPNEDWSEFHPPKTVSHYYRKNENGTYIDIDAFCGRYFNSDVINGYNKKEFSFYLGYYVHLLTDIRWTETISEELIKAHPEEYAADKNKLIWDAKGDWYDLDFLYLKQHPDLRAFAIYENAVGYENEYMDIFGKDAFDNRRQYICGFYHGDEHGDLYREYTYLTQKQADAFVSNTSEQIFKQISCFITEKNE